MKRNILLLIIVSISKITLAQEFEYPIRVSDWNLLWKSAFVESNMSNNAPENGDVWFWGINMNHVSNSENYRYNGQIAVRNSSTSPRMYFRSTNREGTGTWAKVIHDYGNQSINGNLAIHGKIESKEIKVTQAPSADFVFNEDYTLKSLEEVETYISKNKHLPDIPSEAEVKVKGINLGEMNAKLLQKIEELTLYTIAQDKEIKKLKSENSRIEKQEKKIEKLETLVKQLIKNI